MLLYDYLKTHPEFQGYEVKEFCDDGYSGKRLDRPQFNEMLNCVRQGEIHCIIVKDFSRFCRDYIEIGNYLEQLFPFMGIRFIAVTDNYWKSPSRILSLIFIAVILLRNFAVSEAKWRKKESLPVQMHRMVI